MSLLPPLITLIGPTAAGKTALSLTLAERFNGVVVSADSRCVYRGLDIGTAKPTPAEQARVPHHLLDVVNPDEPWALADYQMAATAAITEAHCAGRVPFLVGGTGQYIHAVTQGWQPPPHDDTGALRAELEAQLAGEGLPALVARLQAVDPDSARQVDTRNPRRVVRALEVALLTGESFVAQRRQAPPPWRILHIGVNWPRPLLYARVDARIDAMLTAGWLEETRALHAQGYGWHLPALSAVGYKQLGAYLRGECSWEDAVRHIRAATRQLARRQANWFKADDPAIHWFTPPDEAAILRLVAEFLQAS